MTGKILQLLIAEDDEHDFDSLSRVLKKYQFSYEITWLKDGSELINYLDQLEKIEAPLRVFILDINLPKVNGLELVLKIRDHEITKNNPIFMLTGSTSKSDRETAFNNGADLFLKKPFGKQQTLEFSNLLLTKLSSISASNI